MTEQGRLLAEHTERLKKILAKHKAGKALSAAELAAIGGEAEEKESYDSLWAAAAGMRVPRRVLQEAKKAGAPGFRGSRVYPGELLPWLDQHGDELEATKRDALEEEKLREQGRKLRFENDLKEGLYLEKGKVEEWVVRTIECVKTLLENRLKNELPAKLEGLRAAEIAAKLEVVCVDVCNELRKVA